MAEGIKIDCPRCGSSDYGIGVCNGLIFWRCESCGFEHVTDQRVFCPDREPSFGGHRNAKTV